MEIKSVEKVAEKKNKIKVLSKKRQMKDTEIVNKSPHEIRKLKNNFTIQINVNELLYDTMRNIITSRHTSNDYTYSSVSDIIRSSLEEYKNGMELTELCEEGEKTSTSIKVSAEIKAFYSQLPDRLRRKILEKAIRTFIKTRLK